MRVLVTGAAGFIGRHVCKLLKERGHAVVALDLREPGEHVDMWISKDITQPLAPSVDVDAVIHLAAMANPRECDRSPGRAHLVNVHGTWNVLEMARKSGAHKFVFSSSAHVYGIPPLSLPTGEDAPLQPQSTYIVTKILGEELCKLYWRTYRLSYAVLRLFNTYGLEQGPGFFIPDMLAKAKQGRIDLQGSHTSKDFIYVTDVARAFVAALDAKVPCTLNVGSGRELLLYEVASEIAERFQASFHPQDDGKATRMRADISFIKSVLGWEPKVSLKEGLDAVCDAAKSAVPAHP